MKTDYLFMAGEFKISMGLVFKTLNWSWTMSQSQLTYTDGRLFRVNQPREDIRGVIHYANCQDSELESGNLWSIMNGDIPCWPPPNALIEMLDRHRVMQRCIDHGLVTNNKVFVSTVGEALAKAGDSENWVVKTGNEHRGLGKYLWEDDWSRELEFTDLVTVEPFYEGESVRVLIIGDREFGIRMTNEDSWIKNAPGAEKHLWDTSKRPGIVNHARKVADHFGLDVAGVDYIVDKDDKYHFLEVNQYPGLAGFDDIGEYAKTFLRARMDEIEIEIEHDQPR